MNKTAIKNYAVWARRELIEKVTARAAQYGITAENTVDADADSVEGRVLSEVEKTQRKALIQKVNEQGFEQVMEEVAYTWFNRFAALRFMEVNSYLPSHVRVFTDDENNFKPQILTEAIHIELEGLDKNKVYEFKNANQDEELFRYLLVVQCNALNEILPKMFQKIEDYTELLLPENLLRNGSVIQQMIELIPEEDFNVEKSGQVEIIGWLYQYYNIEPKAAVFAKKGKITKEEIPAATQLFTPEWIVKYMVENSLGRLWIERNEAQTEHDIGYWESNNVLKSNWEYYIEEAEQDKDVESKLAAIRSERKNLKPEDIKCIDPCSGSGHILCYMFDVLMQIYQDYGYTEREAVVSILENNLFGLDIDERAEQLSYFSVMMKARQYDRRFFSRNIQPHIYAVEESNNVTLSPLDVLGEAKDVAKKLLASMHDAKEYGSILTPGVTLQELDILNEKIIELNTDVSTDDFIDRYTVDEINIILKPFVDIAIMLLQKYDVVVTNPPYMPVSNGSDRLKDYIKNQFKDSKSDLFAVFIERCGELIVENGYQAMITMHSWMFLSSFEKLREKLTRKTLINMAHLGARAFEEIGGEVVQTTAFVIEKSIMPEYKGTYCRLIEPNTQQGKEDMFLAGDNRFITSQVNFAKIPGSPIAYWVSLKVMNVFSNPSIEDYVLFRQGMATSDNNRFLRLWFEVSQENSFYEAYDLDSAKNSKRKWFAYNKGGSYRKWYGNADYVVNWENDGAEMKAFTATLTQGMNVRLKSREYYFKECYSWSKISTGQIAFRYYPNGFAFDVAGCCVFNCGTHLKYFLGLSNSIVTSVLTECLSPTVNYELDHLKKIPIIIDLDIEPNINKLVDWNIELCKQDWDSNETSWNFNKHPLIQSTRRIIDAYEQRKQVCIERFEKLRQNEEKLNEIFSSIYGLKDELDTTVSDESISVRLSVLSVDIKSFISYAVGCMFGRYSLDVEGLAYAGGEFDPDKYKTFEADLDNVIPICDDEYFDDDIVGRFIEFVRVVYGEDTLEENLAFVAKVLGGKGTSREVIRDYFIKDFYKDHCKTYQKRPIYWQFDSGKKNGFKCLIYMHRYRPDTIARIRTDYVHEQQARYRTIMEDLEKRINDPDTSTSERVKLNKQLAKVQAQADEILAYEEKIHHLADQMIDIDLDDGVKHNYEIFNDVLAKIR